MIKLFAFIKDEIDIIEDWLRYHSSIFGNEAIHIIDHSSSDGTEKILKEWKLKGIHLKTVNVPFKQKGKLISDWIKEVGDDYVIPLDADEFLIYDNELTLSADANLIKQCFKELLPGPFRYKLNQFNAVVNKNNYNDPLIEMINFNRKTVDSNPIYAKTFYHHKWFINTDQGNHKGNVNGHGKNYSNHNLAIIHFDVRGYEHFVEKMTRGAIAYGHTKNKTMTSGSGKHYHRRYWAIKEGNGQIQMKKEFGGTSNFKSSSFANKIKELRCT